MWECGMIWACCCGSWPEGGGAQGSGKAGERQDTCWHMFYLWPHLPHFLRGRGQALDVSTRKFKHTVVTSLCVTHLSHDSSHTSSCILQHFAQRLLEYIRPDFIHIMQAGEIVKTGDMSLVDQLEASGYSTLQQPAAVL